MKLQIKQEYQKLVPPLSAEERDELVKYIKQEGFKVDIITNSKGIILDGMTRYGICKEIGIEPSYVVKEFENQLAEEEFVIKNLLVRRNINDFAKGELVLKLEPIESKLAELRQKAGRLASTEAKGKTTEKLAKKGNTSRANVERVKTILDKAEPEIIDKARNGSISVSSAYNQIMNKERIHKSKKISLPTGQYNIFYIDPPWQFDNENTGGSMISGAAQKYPTLSTDEIIAMFQKIPFAKDSVIFMWSTNAMIPDALRILSEIGFTYKGKVTWKKTKFLGMGSWFRNVTEDCLFAIKGDIRAFKCQLPNYIEAQPGKHSEKPDEMRQLIEEAIKDIYPKKKIELFARKESTSWKAWGNEV